MIGFGIYAVLIKDASFAASMFGMAILTAVTIAGLLGWRTPTFTRTWRFRISVLVAGALLIGLTSDNVVRALLVSFGLVIVAIVVGIWRERSRTL